MEFSFIFFLDVIYLFLEGGEEKEKEQERNINVWLPLEWPLLGTWPTTQACALTGNPTGNLLVRRSSLSHTILGGILKYIYNIDTVVDTNKMHCADV